MISELFLIPFLTGLGLAVLLPLLMRTAQRFDGFAAP